MICFSEFMLKNDPRKNTGVFTSAITHFPMSGLIVGSGSFNRIYVKPMDTSLKFSCRSKINEYLIRSRGFSLPRSTAEHAFQRQSSCDCDELPTNGVNEIELLDKTRLFVVLFGG